MDKSISNFSLNLAKDKYSIFDKLSILKAPTLYTFMFFSTILSALFLYLSVETNKYLENKEMECLYALSMAPSVVSPA